MRMAVREVGRRRGRFGDVVCGLFGWRSRSLVLREVACLRLGLEVLLVRCGGEGREGVRDAMR
jgi:hypothetical protein